MKISICRDFSKTPGARYILDGPHSGEEFFEKVLDNAFRDSLDNKEKLVIDLDGTEGFATSFLDEAFSRLAAKYGSKNVLDNLQIISNDEPDWVEEIQSYISDVK